MNLVLAFYLKGLFLGNLNFIHMILIKSLYLVTIHYLDNLYYGFCIDEFLIYSLSKKWVGNLKKEYSNIAGYGSINEILLEAMNYTNYIRIYNPKTISVAFGKGKGSIVPRKQAIFTPNSVDLIKERLKSNVCKSFDSNDKDFCSGKWQIHVLQVYTHKLQNILF